MRLRWGPNRDRTPEQVLLRDPLYVIEVLDRQPAGVLASIFRDLVTRFDALPLTARCARCGGPARELCAYRGSVDLIGYCRRCLFVSPAHPTGHAVRIAGYEDALRHVASSFRRGLRQEMRRIVAQLSCAKGGPDQATEAACEAFLHTPGRERDRGDRLGRSGDRRLPGAAKPPR